MLCACISLRRQLEARNPGPVISLSRFAEKQRYACQVTPLLKITEHDRTKDIRERNTNRTRKGEKKETAEKQQVNCIMLY